MRKWTLPLAAAGLAALSFGALHAQQGGPPQLPGQMDASRVTAGTYKSDPAHSLIGWRVNHFGFNDYYGIFGDDDATTRAVIAGIQEDGTCWASGTTWQGLTAMRISVSNWATTGSDVDRSVEAMLRVYRGVVERTTAT